MKLALNIVKYSILSATAILLIFPIYWMMIGAVKPSLSPWASPPEWFPAKFTWYHVEQLFERKPTLRWLFNSLFTAFVAIFFILLFCSMAGYAYAKKKFPGHQILFFLVIATMMMPRQVTLVPLYLLISDLGLLDSYMGLLLPILAFPFGVFLVRQFVKYIPDDFVQAAQIDGAGEMRIFARIIVPLLRPVLGALATFSFMAVWNDYIWQLIVLQKENMKTLPVGVAMLMREGLVINYGLAMAGGTLAALPLVILFLLFQKSFIHGMTLDAEK